MCLLFGLVFSLVGVIVNVIGIALPHWLVASSKNETNSGQITMGLWSLCIHGLNGSVIDIESDMCTTLADSLETVPLSVIVTRWLTLTGAAIKLISALTGLFMAFRKTPNRILLFVAGLLAIVGGLLVLVGCGVFGISNDLRKMLDIPEWELKDFEIHFGLLLCVGSAGIAMLAAFFFCCGSKGKYSRIDNETF